MTVRKEIEQNEWLETKVENRTDAMFKNEVIKNRVLMNFLISVWDQILRSKDFHKIFNFFFYSVTWTEFYTKNIQLK